MKAKKILSLLVAIAMIFGMLGVPVFADSAISGTFNGGHMNISDPEEIFITTEIANLNATESVVVEIYSDETHIATSELQNKDYYVIGALTVKTCLTGESSSWKTTWEEGMPRADLVPTSGTLYVDGTEMNSAKINMRDSADLVVDWTTLDGVNPAPVAADLEIGTAEDLKAFAEAVNAGNTYSGKLVVLANDIDLAGSETNLWTPIGTNADAYYFAGTFDGQEHTIKNLYVKQGAAYHAAGLFGAVRGTVKNFTIDTAYVESISSGAATDNGTAVVVGSTYCGKSHMVENVHVKNATVKGNRYVAGIVGYMDGTVKNCSVENITIVATPDNLTGTYDNGDKVGGIVGYCNSESVEISGCELKGNVSITAYRDVAGIVGCASSAVKVNSNTNNATLDITIDTTLCGERDNYNVGEFIGRNTPSENTGNITTESASYTSTVKVAPAGTVTPAYTKEVDGNVRVWGEGGGNASESLVLELYSGETKIATTELNNVGGIINGDVYVTWNFYYPESNDEYWTTTWEEGHPNSAAQPDKVVLYVDGVAVAENVAKMNAPDDLAPVVWEELGGVEYIVTGLSGTGTEEDPYLISNLAELKWFRDKVDEQAADGSTQFVGKYFKLTADIDLDEDGDGVGENWNPIGSMTGDHGSFKGVFDGDGHTISNLNVQTSGNGIGFFARTAGNAEIKNLTFNNAIVKSTDNSNYAGVVVANSYASTKITNVHVTGKIDISGRGYIGGISGHGYVVMDNVSVKAEGTIYSTFWCAGGILGYGGEGATNITNAAVEGTGDGLLITSAAGGLGAIVGMAEDNNGTQPISGSNLCAKNVKIETYVGAYGTSYSDYALGYLYGGNPTSELTGELVVENVKIETSTGDTAPAVNDAVASIGDNIYFNIAEAFANAKSGDVINLLRDILVIDQIKVKDNAVLSDITVNGNGHTITAELNQDNQSVLYFGDTSTSAWATGVKINDLTIDGTARFGIALMGGTSSVLNNVTVTGDYVYGINLYGTHGAEMTDCDIVTMFTNAQDDNPLNLVNTHIGTLYANQSDVNSDKGKITIGDNSTVDEFIFWGESTKMVSTGLDKITTITPKSGTLIADLDGVLYTNLATAIADVEKGETLTLLADVDLTDVEWTPVEFVGATFDGNGKTIKNLTVTGTSLVGLFSVVSDAKINNVTLENVTSTGVNAVGTLAGQLKNSTVTNVHVKGEIKVTANYMAGGMAGQSYGSYYNCSVDGTDNNTSYVKATYTTGDNLEGDNVGGMIGHRGEGAGTIDNCSVKNLTVEGTRKVGGMVGSAFQDNIYTNNTVENVIVKTNATLDYATANQGTFGLGGLIGLYTANGNNDGKAENNTVNDVEFVVDDEIADLVTTGVITGGLRGTTAPTETAETMIYAGNTATNVTGADNTYLIEKNEAKIDDVEYKTLAAALSAAKAGETVTLLTDVEDIGRLGLKADVTLDGDGHTISGDSAIYMASNAKSTVKNVKFTDISNGNNLSAIYAEVTKANADTVIENCTFTNIDWDAIQITPSEPGTKITITGNTFDGAGQRYIHVQSDSDMKFDATITGNKMLYSEGVCPLDVYNFTEDSVIDLGGNHIANTYDICVLGENNSNKYEEALPLMDEALENEIAYVAVIKDAYNGKIYTSIDDAVKSAVNGDVVTIIADGTYKLPAFSKNITIEAAEGVDVTIDNGGAVALHSSNVIFNNITFDYYPNVDYTGLQHVATVVYNNCTFNGQVFLYGTRETFNVCTFNQNSPDAYNVWTYGADVVEFNDCIFNSAGKSVLVYNEGDGATKMTAEECEFYASQPVEGKAAVEIDTTLMPDGTEIIINNSTATGFAPGSVSGNTLWNDKKDQTDLTVTVDNELVWPIIKKPAADIQYAAYVEVTGEADTQSYREAVKIDIHNVYAENSLIVELWSGDTKLATTTLRKSDRDDEAVNLYPVEKDAFTTNIVVSGRLSGSWDTVWHVQPTTANTPDKILVYADGILADTYDEKGFINDTELEEYKALNGVLDIEEEKPLGEFAAFIRNIKNDDGNYNVVLIGGVDSLNYANVGFKIVLDGEELEPYTTNKVGTKLKVTGNTYGYSEITPDMLGGGAKYLFADLFTLGESYKDKSLVFTPFATTFDDEVIYGPETKIEKIYDEEMLKNENVQ